MGNGLLGGASNGRNIDVRAFLDSDVTERIGAILDMGVLVSLGTTRDGGAVSLTLTHDGDWDREYFRSSTDATEWLERATGILRERGLTPRSGHQTPVKSPTRTRSRLT